MEFMASLLSWERGLKYVISNVDFKSIPVAPLVGAWIEIQEIKELGKELRSLLSWERGLKFFPVVHIHLIGGRSSRGSVD